MNMNKISPKTEMPFKKKADFLDCNNSSRLQSTQITIDLPQKHLLVKNIFTAVMSKTQFTSKEQLTIS